MVEITLPIVLQLIQTVALLVGIVYYITIMRNQQKTRELALKAQEHATETRQTQIFMQMYNKFYESMADVNALEVIQNTKFDTVEEFLELMKSDETFGKVIRAYGNFYEGLGVLVKEGLINVRLVALMWGGPTRMFWELIEPIVGDWRVAINYPRLWSETEYVCKEVLKYMEEHPELKT